MDLKSAINKALRFGGGSRGGTLIHENEVSILDAATQVLNKSETGRALLGFAQDSGLKMHVLKNKRDFGFLPGESTTYISCPAGQDMPSLRAVIHLAGAIRMAQQELSETMKRPDSVASMTKDSYVDIYVSKNQDLRFVQTAVVYELSLVNGLSEIVDEYASMGYLSLYEAYKKDIKSQQ